MCRRQPGSTLTDTPFPDTRLFLSVDVAPDARGRPVDAIAVEAGHRAGHRGDRGLLRADDVVVGLGVHAHVHAPRVVADVLHDVDLADRKSTRLNSITNAHLVCRLLLEKKKPSNNMYKRSPN